MFSDLLPVPKRVETLLGSCPRSGGAIDVRCDDVRVQRAVDRWRADQGRNAAVGPIRVAIDPTCAAKDDGYRLTVREEGVELMGRSAAGCFHGFQTLIQLSQPTDARGAIPQVPCCTIEDWPDFATRGLLHDVTRGKVPTLSTLKRLADRLAGLKVNQLQLYIEHAFVFDFDHDICGPDDGLTPDDVRELDRYCRERFIDLVPAMATLGHMGRVLSLPQYRHLAEVEAVRPWSEMNWPQRARGLTLDCLNPEAHRLVERMWTEVLDAFTGPVVNICGDEPWDLGRGRNRERLAVGDIGPAYVAHLQRTHELCAARGRRTQCWSDVLRNHASLIGGSLRDSTILHWGYDDRSDYEGLEVFVRAGVDTFACPGTSGWKRILNAMGLAERNIATFAAAGRRHGATGLLNTDWGDHGHFNALACSWHGITLGAALGWDSGHVTGSALDGRFARAVLGLADAAGVGLLRRVSRIADTCETWRLFWLPMGEVAADRMLPTLEETDELGSAAEEARRWWQSPAAQGADPADARELAAACRFSELFAEKVRLARAERPIEGWSDQVAQASREYCDVWRIRNKPSGLQDIRAALRTVADETRPGPVC